MHCVEQTMNITNNTKAKVTIAWTSDASTESSFWVEPQICEIPPLKAQSFRVNFRPDGFDKFFGTKLEAFAFFKVIYAKYSFYCLTILFNILGYWLRYRQNFFCSLH